MTATGRVPKHLITLGDLRQEALYRILQRAEDMRRLRSTPEHPLALRGKTVALLLEKPSTRTRISFEVATHELGGKMLTAVTREMQLGRGETIEDTGRMLSRYVHAVILRTTSHRRLESLAHSSGIPVINGLSERFHPCQLLADLMTLCQIVGTSDRPDVPVRAAAPAALRGVRVAWVGDGNNMAQSWINAAVLTGIELRIACPKGHQPEEALVAEARAQGASVAVTHRPEEAVEGARAIATDVWASMGQEEEAKQRRSAFQGFCVDERLMQLGDRAQLLHCLPAHRGEEVSAEVIDGPRSRVWDEAENRLHAQKALLEWLFE